MRIFFIGDIVGKPGRQLVGAFLPRFRKDADIDFVIANGENAASGKGLTPSVAGELFDAGIDALTGGNHTWKNKEIFDIIDDSRILRPANYPPGPEVPGHGYTVLDIPGTDHCIGILNLLGRVYMTNVDCPFRVARELVDSIRQHTPIILVDFHAEATSEKIALGWYLDGQVSVVVGTHTHVPTADEQILPEGTAYQSDAGMTGAHNGVLGIRKDLILRQMITQMPVRHELADGDLRLCGLLIDIDPATGRALHVERICHHGGK